MNKDVIYIDTEDDITAIIGKIKASQHKIIALVPPKRIGVLQSAVNLRLLTRSIEQSGKHLVLITSNGALSALAASSKIPVAKNLQSKPEIPQISALEIDDGDDVIDGAQLPISDHIGMTSGAKKVLRDDAIIDSTIAAGAAELSGKKALPPRPGQLPPKPKSGIKVPNFGDFRKRLVIGIGAGVLLIVFLIWAIVYAPSATVLITARTTNSSAANKVALSPTTPTNQATGSIQSVAQQLKKDATLSFDATGTKDVGEKAAGQVVFKNCETPTPQTIPAGTNLSANGRSYVTKESATVPGGSGGFGGCTTPGSSSPIGIVAADIGDDYNTPSATTFSAEGHPSGSSGVYFKATASTNIEGGTKKQIKIVTDADIQKAIEQLAAQDSTALKKQLAGQFNSSTIALEQSFKVDQSAVKPAPASGQESPDGKAKLAGSAVYTMVGVERAQVKQYLDAYFTAKIKTETNQRVYSNGADKATLTDVALTDAGATATLTATAQIGPKINDEQIKQTAKGKRYGEIQSAIETIPGVEDVDIKFSPFWVKSAPNDVKRISVQFKLNASR